MRIIFFSFFMFIALLGKSQSTVQFIHTSASTDTIDIWTVVNSTFNKLVDNISFRQASAFLQTTSGNNVLVGIAPKNSTSITDTFFSKNIGTLVSGTNYTIYCVGHINPNSFNPPAPFDFKVFSGLKSNSLGGTGFIGVNVFHGATDISEVDVKFSAPSAAVGIVGNNLDYSESGGYVDANFVQGSLYTVQLTNPSGTQVLYESTPLPLGLNPQANGLAFNFYITGFAVPANNSNGPNLQVCVASSNGNPAQGIGLLCFDLQPIINCSSLNINANVIDASTLNTQNGSISLSISGGTSPYQYTWSNGATTQNINNLSNGSYSVTVKDANNCTATNSFFVGVLTNCLQLINISPSGTTTICAGNSVTLTSTSAATYLWNTGATTQSITVSNGGNYSVTATDINNCASSDLVTINIINLSSQAIIGNPSITPFQTYPYLVNNIPGNSYSWSVQNGAIQSGQNTNSINVIWGGNGPYSVRLIESLGSCSDTSTLLVANSNCNLPINVIISGTTPACVGDSVLLVAQSNQGVNFLWSKDGNTLANQTNDTLLVTSQGSYQIQATSGGCTVLSNATFILFNPTPQTPVIQSSSIQNICNIQPVTLSLNNSYNSYLWSNGATSASTNVSISGNYTVTVTNNTNCKAVSLPLSINLAIIPSTEICIVSVDSATGKNIIVWEKGSVAEIDSFIIYKETNQLNVFDKIGSVSKSAFSTFVDQNSNPQQNADKYTIAALDTCGNVTVQSNPHKTIHLTINQGQVGSWNLIWNHYIGFNYLTYNIYRGINGSNLTQIASISSGNNSYTDFTPPAGLLYYQIEAVHPTGCIPTAKRQTEYNSTKSNIVDNNEIGVGIDNFLNEDNITIYPSPTQENFIIEIENNPFKFFNLKASIYDMQGRLIIEKLLIEKETKFNLKEYNNGIYLIRVQTEFGSINKKLVKQ